MLESASIVTAFSKDESLGAIFLYSSIIRESMKRQADCIISVKDVPCELSSKIPSRFACGRILNVFKKLVAWQFLPSAFSKVSKRKPNSHSRHAS